MKEKYEIAFNTNFVASLTGASLAQLNVWDKNGVVSPSILKSYGRGSVRLYSFKDIVEIKTAVYLRKTGISLKEIKRAVDYLKENFDYNSPLSEAVLLSNGKDILAAPQDKLNDICAKWLAANRYGQRVMAFVVPLGAINQTINAAIDRYNQRIKESVTEDPDTLVSLQDIEEEIFGVSSKIHKKRA